MQVRRSLNKKDLKQGTIFSIKKLKLLSKDKSKTITFKSIYPEVNLDKITYGVVLSQSCDLVLRKGILKTPYIVIALLEPIDKFVTQKLSKKISEFMQPVSFSYKKYIFINENTLQNKTHNNFNTLFVLTTI